MTRVLQIHSSPHISGGRSVERIMFNVVLALLPVTAFCIYAFGVTALLTLSTAVITCVVFERWVCKLQETRSTVSDWSAVITGLLFGLTLPPSLPLWMVVVGAMIGMALGKHLFGGLGMNVFNPALVGRAILQATFPVPMTTWTDAFAENRFQSLAPGLLTVPLTRPDVDIVSAATPLSAFKFDGELTGIRELALGMTSGSVGETSALLIILGGLWLVARRMMNGRITLAILGTVLVLSGMLYWLDPQAYAPPLFMLLSGGLMLGAVFMATDMVGSPMTHLGSVVYGVIIGVIVVAIRTWGGMPEGVMYAILLGNAVTPLIDQVIQPRVFGTKGRLAT